MFIWRSVRLLVHYFEKLMGVNSFCKGPRTSQVWKSKVSKGTYADFQTLQVQMFLTIQEFILQFKITSSVCIMYVVWFWIFGSNFVFLTDFKNITLVSNLQHYSSKIICKIEMIINLNLINSYNLKQSILKWG